MSALPLLLWKNLKAGWRRHWARQRMGRLRLADSLGLGDRRSAGILEVEGRRFLIGSTPHAVTLLAELGLRRDVAAPGGTHDAPDGAINHFPERLQDKSPNGESAA